MICKSCDKDLPEIEFGNDKIKCLPCIRTYNKSWYAKNSHRRSYLAEKTAEKRQRNKIFVINYLQTHHCADCSESDPVVLEFDHRDRADKIAAVAVGVDRAWSLKRLLAEMEKCEVRCANCHRRRTAKSLGWFSEVYAGLAERIGTRPVSGDDAG